MADHDPEDNRAPSGEPLAGVATGRSGRPEAETEGGTPVYGEPKGPRPPHFDILPKEVIETPPQERTAGQPSSPEGSAPDERYDADRERDGYFSGMTTPETRQTTAGPHEKIVRRDLPTFKGERDDDGDAT